MAAAATAEATTEAGGYATVLLAAAGEEGLRKTERTRLRLLAAIAAALNAGTPRGALKVADVTRAAGLAHGTFYRYFEDMAGAIEALIESFARHVRERLAGARQGEAGSRERVRGTTLAYARLFRDNAPLMRCLIGLDAEGGPFARAYRELNRAWYGRMAAAIARRRARQAGGAQADPQSLLPTAYALGGMIDEFLTQVYLRRDPALAHLAADEAGIADLLTDLWWRGAYGAVAEG
ncbi:MAG TPA: TetR/AcrR family transcriptional regulator [Rhizobiales bacterium]|nr:TetR/AcrR family transcriptional regulator [Hyphomicrobiales bacterium]